MSAARADRRPLLRPALRRRRRRRRGGHRRAVAAERRGELDERLGDERDDRGEREVGRALERRVAGLPAREELLVERQQPLDLEVAVRLGEAAAEEPQATGQVALVASQDLPEGVEV